MLFQAPQARIHHLLDAKEFTAQQLARVADLAGDGGAQAVHSAIEAVAQVVNPAIDIVQAAVIDENADEHGKSGNAGREHGLGGTGHDLIVA